MNASEVKVGTIATVKVGRNEVKVTVIAITTDGWLVKSNSSGREFEVKKLENIISEPATEMNENQEATEMNETQEATEVNETQEATEMNETQEATEMNENAAEAAEAAETAETAETAEAAEAAEDDDRPNPAPETATNNKAEKKLSLLEAAVQVLSDSATPLNCKEIIKLAIDKNLWVASGAKTPEQSLYSAMFREIKAGTNPRIRKSTTRKGGFEFNR